MLVTCAGVLREREGQQRVGIAVRLRCNVLIPAAKCEMKR